MSVRYEGAYAAHTSVEVVGEGAEIGEDDPLPEGQAAVVLSYDEVFYLVGTPTELRKLLTRALWKLAADPEPEEAPRRCANCGDGAETLSSRDWCDGCEIGA